MPDQVKIERVANEIIGSLSSLSKEERNQVMTRLSRFMVEMDHDGGNIDSVTT